MTGFEKLTHLNPPTGRRQDYAESSADWQIWTHETSQKIEKAMGPSQVFATNRLDSAPIDELPENRRSYGVLVGTMDQNDDFGTLVTAGFMPDKATLQVSLDQTIESVSSVLGANDRLRVLYLATDDLKPDLVLADEDRVSYFVPDKKIVD